MIHLIGIGNDKGNITLNAFKAIKGADIIINHDNVDLTFFDSEIKDKEIISAIDLINGIDLELDEDSSIDLDEESNFSLLERYIHENYIIDLAISKSLESKEVVLIVSDDPNILGLANRFLQIKSKYDDIKYKIYPGVSYLSQSASYIGAPLEDFAFIDLTKPIMPLSELELKVKNILEANLILVIKNPVDDKREDGREAYEKLKEIVKEFNSKLLTAIVIGDDDYSIDDFEDIDDGRIDKDSIIFIGNKLSHRLDGSFISSSDYIIEHDPLEWSIDFFEKYLRDESPKGLDYDCDYLPCHKELEACDFCYCPFYPCADAVTGGYWIKGKEVWSCQNCDWIHKEEPCKAIREGLDDILENIDDLKEKHIELLRLRRKCLLKTFK